MKRVILIIVGLLIAAGFSLYILDLHIFQKANAGDVAVASASPGSSAVQNDAAASVGGISVASDVDAMPTQAANAAAIPDVIGPDGTRWQCVWRDTFDAPTVDLENWTEVERRDNYNNELQYYTPLNSYIEDGCLVLTAKKENKDGKRYTSGMVQTEYKRAFRYGRIEARMRLPHGKGLFPAFWLLSENYEIDVMEMIGSEPDVVYGVNHCMKNGRLIKTYGTQKDVDTENFHTYTLEWEHDVLRWYIDDTLYYETTKYVPDEEMYIIFTLAVGGVWPGSPNSDTAFPSRMMIDEIALYRTAE
jgi:beta-glucanase (GH16 family)